MNCEIINVGTELLLGDIVNTNSRFLAGGLAGLGIDCYFHHTVGDNKERLSQVLSSALQRSDLVILTGGLGPTDDDLTRETVASVVNLPLMPNGVLLEKIRHYFSQRNRTVPEKSVKQAFVPLGATVFENDFGLAPGLAISYEDKEIILLPGPPRELEPMFKDKVLPYLQKYAKNIILSKTLKCFGMDEALIEITLSDLISMANPTTGIYAKDSEVHIRVTAKEHDRSTALELMQPVVQEIKNRLGVHIYGEDEDTLSSVLSRLLYEKQRKVAIAESCTGGLICAALTDIPGASGVFDTGVVTYSNAAKAELLSVSRQTLSESGAVSRESAAQMALGIRSRAQSDIGIAVSGIAGPSGGTEEKPVGLVFVAVADAMGVFIKELHLGEDTQRKQIRTLTVSHALDMARHALLKTQIYQEALEPADAFIRKDDVFTESAKVPFSFGLLGLKKPQKETVLQTDTVSGETAASETPPDEASLSPEGEGVSPQKDAWYLRALKYLFPWKGDPKKEKIRKVAFLGALVIFLGAGLTLVNIYAERYAIDLQNKKLEELLNGQPSAEDIANLPPGYLTKFAGLYKINPDIAGWIKIDNTKISYPIMRSKDDREFYLYRDFYKKSNRSGTPFMDSRNGLNPLSTNTVIYGHNIKPDRMFAQLTKYRSLDFYRQHPVIDFDTVYEEAKWKIFAAFIVNTLPEHGDIFQYQNFIEPMGDQKFDKFLEECLLRSMIHTSVDVLPTDQLLTLSTCTYEFKEARLVVVARKVRPGESADVDVLAASMNPNAKYPDIWYEIHGLENPFKNNTIGKSHEPSIGDSGESVNPVESANSDVFSDNSSVSSSSSMSSSATSNGGASSTPSSPSSSGDASAIPVSTPSSVESGGASSQSSSSSEASSEDSSASSGTSTSTSSP